MIGERENIYQDANYGALVARTFDIEGNEINAFYDAKDNLVFVLDNTINAQKPNVLLVINPDGDKKWDEILSADYGLDLETVRPKVDNKYQKLDIEYSGLSVYENLINAYNAGTGLEEPLNQLAVLRDSAARHSAMMRLNIANETISKTNATIVKTKETIVRLETRLKTLRSSLSATKKEIGRVNTKQSASKILKLESQIEATNEKLKRAKKRLESAQKRLEIATVDAELASDLLNQPSVEIKQTTKNKPVAVAREYPVQKTVVDVVDDEDEKEDDENMEEETEEELPESDVKPLFEKDPQILNEDIAFKPIEFNAPVFNDINTKQEYVAPVVEESTPIVENISVEESAPVVENKPVLESFTPVEIPEFVPEQITEETTEIVEEKPVLETMKPVLQDIDVVEQTKPVETTEITETTEPVVPIVPKETEAPITPMLNTFQAPVEIKEERSKPGFLYYLLLLALIVLSVFTLWLYQKNVSTDSAPVLTTTAAETSVLEPKKPVKQEIKKAKEETVFFDEEPEVKKEAPVQVVNESVKDEEENESDEEPIAEPNTSVEEPVDVAPVVIDAVPGRLNTSGASDEDEKVLISEEDILASKPVFEPGAKYDNMFVNEQDLETEKQEPVYEPEYEYADYEDYGDYDGYFFDEEEAAYQAEMNNR